MLKKIATACAATALVATPVMAQAANGAETASATRTSTALEQSEEFGGGGSGLIIGLLALAAVVAALVIAFDDGDDPEPASP